MTLRVIQAGLGRPTSYFGSPNDTFQPGQIGQMKLIGNDVVLGVSDGIAPIGIIDDIRTQAFTQSVIDEEIIVEMITSFDGYNWVNTATAKQEIKNSNIVPSSFRYLNADGSTPPAGLSLNPVNGVLQAQVGAIANYQTLDSNHPNAIRVMLRYAFYIPNIPGEDSTLGSGRITIWFTRGIFQTDQYEMVPYQVNATLFVSVAGKLTSERTKSNQPGVAICLIPPTAHNTMMEFLWQ